MRSNSVREGWEYLDEAVDKKTGAILLMSHIGNWELAAQTSQQKRPADYALPGSQTQRAD